MEYLIDTSALFALLNRDDPAHSRANQIFKDIKKEHHSLILLNFILAETHTLLRMRVGHENARTFLGSAIRDYTLLRVMDTDEMMAFQFLQGSPYPLQLSYFDAVLCAVADRLKTKKIFAFDKHFELMGLQLLKPSHG